MNDSLSDQLIKVKANIHDLDTEHQNIRNQKRGIKDVKRLGELNKALKENRDTRKSLAKRRDELKRLIKKSK